MKRTALVVGNSGIVGAATGALLNAEGWEVHGVSRSSRGLTDIHEHVTDLTDAADTARVLAGVAPEVVFITTWSRQATEARNIAVNAAMVRHVFDGLRAAGGVRHVALVTGLKHYLGPFESYGKGSLPPTPFREDQPRLPVDNFYYAQEDEVFAAAKRDGFTWSVHRPHTVIGHAVGNAMNMGTTIAVHASLCAASGRPFVFPGSAAQWNGLTDMTDARLLARHLLWAATEPRAADQAFNVVNGDVFRWSWMWTRIADWFQVDAEAFDGVVRPLEDQMAADAPRWRELAERTNLAEPDLARLTSPWHTDADLGRPIEVVADMSKSRRLGFTAYQATDDAFFDLFQRLRNERLIP